LYATLAQHVAERAREISIRLALGARGTHIVRWLGMRVARLIAVAVILGVVAAAVSSRAMSSLLFGVPIADPLTYATVCVVVVISAVAGASLPLRRAMLLDPVQTLRQE
jgi:putative ABC transport system permease protein